MIYILDRKQWPNYDPAYTSMLHYIDFEYFMKNILFKGNRQDRDFYVDILRSTAIGFDTNDKLSIAQIENILNINKNIKIFGLNLDVVNEDELPQCEKYINKLAEKYDNVFFIFFYYECQFRVQKKSLKIPNVIYIANAFEYDPEILHDIYPYYLINSYANCNITDKFYEVYKEQVRLRKFKKYNFFNGVHKPHRIIGYELIKKHQLLEEGFFSYLDYTRYARKHTNIELECELLDITHEEFKNYISSFEIPYHNDTYHENNQPGVYSYPFINPPMYSWQSYISITAETNYEISNNISMSEKSFKPFSGFNIPLIYGQPRINTYLKNIGFDMFEDLFDIRPMFNFVDMKNQLDKNLKIIKDMSLEELHNFYLKNYGRIETNYNTLMKYKTDIFYDGMHTKIEQRLGPRYRI